MAGNTFGTLFRVTTWGESHGRAIGAVIDGCPPGIELTPEIIQKELDKRRPGTFRPEQAETELTTGTPISLVIFNKDAHSASYNHLKDIYRPGHGDITYQAKYGIRDHRGGGRASARETAARVAAGAVASQLLAAHKIQVTGYTVALGGIHAGQRDLAAASANRLFCPDGEAAERMEARIAEVREQGDTLGGIVEIMAVCPPGLGEPVFDKLDGILAGISSGEHLIMRVAVKPIPSIGKEQQTVNRQNEPVAVKIGGRHDISAIPRIVPVCEAMVRLTLADHLLRQIVLHQTDTY
jgi:chorismate synthase